MWGDGNGNRGQREGEVQSIAFPFERSIRKFMVCVGYFLTLQPMLAQTINFRKNVQID